MRLVFGLVALALICVSDYAFFKVGRSYERSQAQPEIEKAQSDNFHNKRALEGCEEANHVAMEDAKGCSAAKQQAQECEQFFQGLNNLGEILK